MRPISRRKRQSCSAMRHISSCHAIAADGAADCHSRRDCGHLQECVVVAVEPAVLTIGKPLDTMELKELATVRAAPFLLRLLACIVLAAAAAAVITAAHGWLALVAMAILGQLFAHGVELEHQTLHNTAFRGRSWNRGVGFMLGLPMLVS